MTDKRFIWERRQSLEKELKFEKNSTKRLAYLLTLTEIKKLESDKRRKYLTKDEYLRMFEANLRLAELLSGVEV